MLNRRKDKYRKLKKEALKSEVLNTSAVKIKKKSKRKGITQKC